MAGESYFSFNLGKGKFSLPVKFVKEVFDFESITPIPNSLEYLEGVMNVRGSVVSIADLRKLFGFEFDGELLATKIIILEIPRETEKPVLLGIIADKVENVDSLNFVQAESKDYGIKSGQEKFVSAVARRGEDFILVLNPVRILDFMESDVENTVNSISVGNSVIR